MTVCVPKAVPDGSCSSHSSVPLTPIQAKTDSCDDTL